MNLTTLRTLYRDSQTLALWGIPYRMRSGQSPRDIWENARRSQEEALTRPPGTYGATERPCPPADWVWLGSPGWWGHLAPEDRTTVKEFLAQHRHHIPGNPHEWCDLGGAGINHVTKKEHHHGTPQS